ncbi:hypothetical protein SAMN05421852_102277 [Thermoflavimicrobium dichotomicum]|uniref:Uncharacterized protein n=1 Tax=Thermoflavimicrobium dichotomicum TaxID=46223 RepID=A0A1I3LQ24_9BACL|nr:hypothetical protein SAMN05421852_102277 [Thermoflavimicrobium dichotomicum]
MHSILDLKKGSKRNQYLYILYLFTMKKTIHQGMVLRKQAEAPILPASGRSSLILDCLHRQFHH